MHIGSKEWSDLLIEGATAFDIDLTPDHTRQFAVHAAELFKWNRKINLTAITDPLAVAVKHFLDSLTAARFIPPESTLLDIGSGGGFPGLPLKVFIPSLSVTLIDASRKKVNFLKHVIRTLQLKNIDALHIRAEKLAQNPQYRNRYQIVTSRALSSLNLFCSLATPLLTEEGMMIALKGVADKDEAAELKGRAAVSGRTAPAAGRRLSISAEEFRLPILNSRRSIFIVKAE